MQNFFRTLDLFGVQYMIISGQAAILYGAATFSEDIDLWVAPEKENWEKLMKLLRKFAGRVYKLTPPITLELILKGHGFHFEFPPTKREQLSWFLDVLGILPRLSTFDISWQKAISMKACLGKIKVIGLRALVEIKKTRRLEDYPVISNLVRVEYEKLSTKKISLKDWEWILTNSYNLDDILYYFERHRASREVARFLQRPCLSYCLKFIDSQQKKEKYFKLASKKIALEIEESRHRDRQYWAPILTELRELKENGKLLPQGSTPPDRIL